MRKVDSATLALFSGGTDAGARESLGAGAALLRGFVLSDQATLLADLRHVVLRAPFRHMATPGGHRMSVAMTNCGTLGWVSERTGYRYDDVDPASGRPWPRMPDSFCRVAERAAATVGFPHFSPDACLVNRYEPGARMSLHQDKNEASLREPIVSVSLGIAAIFLFGGMNRTDRPQRVLLEHGDVVVWGGTDRLRYHGVQPVKAGYHPSLGGCRINLTFRKAA